MTRKGQITIPAEIRKAMGIHEGDTVTVSLNDAEPPTAELRRAASVADQTFGAVTPRKRPEDLKELRQRFMEGQGQEDAEAQPLKRHGSHR